MKNIDIAKTQIDADTRVSSAAIWYNELFGSFYQYETWIFRKETLKSEQTIHGTYHEENKALELITIDFHEKVSRLLKLTVT